jgi:hypothetical protein
MRRVHWSITTSTTVRGEPVVHFDQGDVVHQEASHTFPFPIRYVRIVPQPREVRPQRENARAGIGVDGQVRVSLPLIDRLGVGSRSRNRIVVPVSATIACTAVYWTVERLGFLI